ncbi:MAG TPA: Hsp20/alpha crystallin family protein [Verrucomicrobiae bacterium]|jgi:HSP20 family protein|nr:Hsp20/alpha crystallin family protein [Verrucomicrobiae bacterium]
MKKKSSLHFFFRAAAIGAASFLLWGPAAFAESAQKEPPANANQANIQTGNGMEDPFADMQSVQQNMQQFFNQFNQRWNQMAKSSSFQPDTDLQDKGDAFVATLDLPGMQKDQIKIDVTEDTLTVSGERQSDNQEKNKQGYYSMERTFGSFRRSMSLPEKVVPDNVTAKYDNGVLEIKLPKLTPQKEQQKTKSVPVQ